MAPPSDVSTISRLTFYAPTHVRYRYRQPGGAMVSSTCLYATPTAPGRARVFLCDAAYEDPAPAPAPEGLQKPKTTLAMRWRFFLMILRFKLLPPFFTHFAQSFIFDSDGVLLFQQGGRLAASLQTWTRAYYLVSSDNFVASLRAWIDRVGGGGPTYAPGAPPPPPRPLSARVALDRDTQHTALCSLCQQGRAQVTRTRNALVGVAAAAALAAVIAAGRAAMRASLVTSVLAAIAALAAAGLHRRVLPQFGFVGHVHADND